MGFIKNLFGSKSQQPEPEPKVTTGPGRQLIETSFGNRYLNQKPRCAGRSKIEGKHDFTGKIPPIEAWYVYDAGTSWQLVTVGMSDLYEKSNPNSSESGFGFELSIRVRKRGENMPPKWPILATDRIASFAMQRETIAPGVSFATGPIEGAQPDIAGFIALVDPEFQVLNGPFGKVAIVLLVGLSQSELDGIRDGKSGPLIEQIAANPERWLS